MGVVGGSEEPSGPARGRSISCSKLAVLVERVKGEGAEAREAQRAMVAQMQGWLEAGAPALVEAPTGTGKSYAILAAASSPGVQPLARRSGCLSALSSPAQLSETLSIPANAWIWIFAVH